MKKALSVLGTLYLCVMLVAGCSKNNPAEPELAPQTGKLTLTMSAIKNVASGMVTITKGEQSVQQPITIVNSEASVSFENIEAGAWSITVQLFNSDHVEIYSATSSVNVVQGQLTVAEVLISSTDLVIRVKIGTLMLWNKLGSQAEVLQSLAGPEGNVAGNVFLFSGVKYGNGVTTDSQSSYLSFDNSCFDSTQGTIEFWFKPNFAVVNGNIQGDTASNQDWVDQESESGRCKLQFGFKNGHFLFTWTTPSFSTFIAPQFNWAANEVHHFALTYDANLHLCFYLDGALIKEQKSQAANTYDKETAPFRILSNTNSTANKYHIFLDNLKVWDYPKTEFSDRFTE